jgi:alkanesulfonate monooxygenase SsuD/methylene tetrahydromethanopterin reductase-like flavin-dependent oxidoreductase (luciferase family)
VAGRDPTGFPTTLATTWLYVTDDDTEARAFNERLSLMLRRPIDEIEGRLPVGSPAACLDLLGRYRDAGLGRVLVWPMHDEVEQLERVAEQIMAPLSDEITIGPDGPNRPLSPTRQPRR